MINWTVRAKNPAFWTGLVGTIAAPILAYYGMQASDFTSWDTIADTAAKFVSNPYLVFTVLAAVLSALGITVDPTTKGVGDSAQALAYSEPSSGDIDADTSADAVKAYSTPEEANAGRQGKGDDSDEVEAPKEAE